MRFRGWMMLPFLAALVAAGCGQAPAPAAGGAYAGRVLVLFVGSASQPPSEVAIAHFEALTGAQVEAQFGGSGEMLSRMKLAGQGGIYFPGSSDYMEMAKREGLVDPESEVIVAYLVPAINVPRGNPKNITSLEDLARPGIRVGIARPDSVCVGLYAVEVLEHAGLAGAVRPNIVTHAESCAKTAQLVALGQADAVLGWEVFEHWNPAKITTVYLPPEQVPRIGYLPAAMGMNTADQELAQAFLDFLVSDEGQAFYRDAHYLVTVEEARQLTRTDAPVGGEWRLPAGW
jgi:molybdate transport system substrate-binding protein